MGPHADTAVRQYGGDVTAERRVQGEVCFGELGGGGGDAGRGGAGTGRGITGLWPRPSSQWSHQL